MSSSNRLFKQLEQSLNEVQKSTLREFSDQGLTEAHFANRSWFNDYYHQRAFSFLVENKHFSIDQAFAELDQLDKDQVAGISQGLSRDEVLGLDSDQIDAYLKHGLPKSELQGLNRNAIQALLGYRKHGLQAEDLCGADWFEYQHLRAFAYLVTIKKYTCKDALSYLQGTSALVAKAIGYGCEKSDVVGLEPHQINALIESRGCEGLKSRQQVAGLLESQIQLVKNLYQFGMTSELAQKYSLNYTSELNNVLSRLIIENGFNVSQALWLVIELDIYQARGVADGLTKEEVRDLKEHHINALIKCKTIKNGLSADDLRGKDWFNDEKHVDALWWLLYFRHFTAKDALVEITDLSGPQAYDLARHDKRRDDVVGLAKWHLEALDKFEIRRKGITGSHLRGKDWFNSIEHVDALQYLLDRKRMTPEEAMQELEGLDSRQAALVRQYGREKVLKLTPVQRKILDNRYEYGFYGNPDELIDATWLKTDEQAQLLKEIHNKHAHTVSVLAVVKKASETPEGVSELLKLVKEGKVGDRELRDFLRPTPAAEVPVSTTRSDEKCLMM